MTNIARDELRYDFKPYQHILPLGSTKTIFLLQLAQVLIKDMFCAQMQPKL